MGADDQPLSGLIESVECLNEDSGNPVGNLFKGDGFLQSDADHQLLIKIKFRQPVRINGLHFRSPDETMAASEVRIFTNNMNLDFSSAEDGAVPTDELFLTKDQCNIGSTGKSVMVPLKFAKFRCVNDISFFVMENHGNEELTQMSKLELFGAPVENSNIADWKPCKS